MASPGGTSSSSQQLNSSSEEGMQMQIMVDRKRKRMQSNRESARRSRMRKQKRLDDLTAQVSHLRKTNHEIVNHIKLTTQQFVKVEAQNSVLRAQMSELSSRLQSLKEIISVLGSINNNQTHNHNHNLGVYGIDQQVHEILPVIPVQPPLPSDCFLINSWNCTTSFNHPIMASSSTMFHC